ncbi:TIGR04222 domain-containing membrane protein [Streptomyces sp. CB03238]|uniref:TIGR04222 domain-containing membrane protein n=1 Tax=Streptomyces sp. CB03238 TaxID=1907777 RepID=UPI000A0F8CA1|nr:TIGR04222 domain-containing membrane protein [Streptomyces sp. CB03238]ORT58235.1 hypothetical protein BKD26_20240 [Streptomyces sp. CB03238]
MWGFIGAACALLVMAVALLRGIRTRGGTRPAAGLPPQEVALLRGGRRAAVTVALVALHRGGAVAAGRRGTVRRDGWALGARDPLRYALHGVLHRAVGVRVLAGHPRVRGAVDSVRDELVDEGLLRPAGRWRAARTLLAAVPVTVVTGLLVTPPGTAPCTPLATGASAAAVVAAAGLWCVPRRTRAARRPLARLRACHPLPPDRHGRPGKEVLMCVALYGDPALLLFHPHFARDGGLLGRGGNDPGFTDFHGGGGGLYTSTVA